MRRLFLSSSYRPRAHFFSHHPIDLGPGRESGASFSRIVFFSHHPIDLGSGRESETSSSLIILRPRAREGE